MKVVDALKPLLERIDALEARTNRHKSRLTDLRDRLLKLETKRPTYFDTITDKRRDPWPR